MNEINPDGLFMKEAYKQAQLGFAEDEIPVGAVVVCNNKIIAKAYNQCEKLNDVTAHAEMLALTSAFNYVGAKYLDQCTLYVSLEPCVMCAGAAFWAKLKRVVYAVPDPQRGFTNIKQPILHPKTALSSGVMAAECKLLLDDFFKNLRNE